MFKVRRTACDTCIYKGGIPLNRDLEEIEAEIKDEHGYFDGYRICHHSGNSCCRGFWNKHKDDFPAGQIAQRLGFVEFVDEENLEPA